MTLHNLNSEQTNIVEDEMVRLQKRLELQFDTTGGDHIGIDP